MSKNNQKNVYILSFTLFVVMLGYGMVIPIIPFYMEDMGAGGAELGLLVASYAVMRLFFGPLWGSLSDRIGRKPVLMIGILGYGITMILFGLSTRLWMMFSSRILSGILSSATSPTTMAYIGDSTAKDERSKGMGILGAVIGLGTIAGPAVGGLLAGESLALPFFIAAVLSFLALLLVWLLLPESLSTDSRKPADQKQNSIMTDLNQALKSPIGILLIMAFLASFAMTSFFGIFGLYVLQKFERGTETVGMILMLAGIMSAIAQGVLIQPLVNKWGETLVIKAALITTAIGFIAISFAYTLPLFYIAIGLLILPVALLTPAVSSITSRDTHLEQGITMGLSNSFMSLGRIAGPLLAGFTFDINIEYPNYLGAIVMLIGGIVSIFLIRNPKIITRN